MDLYQSLVTVNPVTLIAQICNLFIQLFLAKKLFLDKVKAILDQRREAADKEIADAQAAHAEAAAIKQTYEQNMKEARAKADELIMSAQRTAASRSDEIISQAQQAAAQIKQKAASDIEMEKKKAINDAKNEISGLAMAIAGKVVERELSGSDQEALINRFIDELGG
ncbi:MAG: F0F1 ATP synthase subunit B [Oscillospiraceae bacterium]|nr:F0F1 ATP synthase subunit B [Oscillospiraceae bacterium]